MKSYSVSQQKGSSAQTQACTLASLHPASSWGAQQSSLLQALQLSLAICTHCASQVSSQQLDSIAHTHSSVGGCTQPAFPVLQQVLGSPPVPNVPAPVPNVPVSSVPSESSVVEVAVLVGSSVVEASSGSQVAAHRFWARSAQVAVQSNAQQVGSSSQTQDWGAASSQPGPAWASQHPSPEGNLLPVVASVVVLVAVLVVEVPGSVDVGSVVLGVELVLGEAPVVGESPGPSPSVSVEEGVEAGHPAANNIPIKSLAT